MEELITLNQLKDYDNEKTNIWHNNITTNNLTADNVNVSKLVTNVASFSGINANGKLGDNGQVLGKNNGVLEWMNVSGGGSVDTDNLIVNNITINNSATVYGDVFTHKGFDVASTKLIPEDDYNNLGSEARNDAFYITGPNGNMYFMGMKWTPSYVPTYPGSYVAYVDLHNVFTAAGQRLNFTSEPVTNAFPSDSGYNGILGKTPFGEIHWDNSAPVGTNVGGSLVNTNAKELYIINASNMYSGKDKLRQTFIFNYNAISNAPADYDPMKYCTNMSYVLNGCSNYIGPVSIGNNVTDISSAFKACVKLGIGTQLNIPDSVINMSLAFNFCVKWNLPTSIGNNVTDMSSAFAGCTVFNQPVNIPNSVTNLSNTFLKCNTLANSTVPIHISHTIALGNTSNYIYNCLVNGYAGIAFDPSRILNDL